MFGDYGKELLRSGIIEAKAGHREAARRYLDRAVYASQDHDVMAEAWFWMSQVLDEAVEKHKALENCLAHDLQHAPARKALAILDGKLKADEIINPDQLPPVPEGLRAADAQRFVCPKCGGACLLHPMANHWFVNIARVIRRSDFHPYSRVKKISSLPWQPCAATASRLISRFFIVKAAALNSFCLPSKFQAHAFTATRRTWSALKIRKTCSRLMESCRIVSISNVQQSF